MKRVCIDASLAYRNDGTGRVSYNLTKELLKDPKYDYMLIEYKEDIFPEYSGKKILSKYSGKGGIRALWYLCVLPYLLWKNNIDVFYSYEAFSTPILFKGKTILTIHDLIPIKIKTYYAKLLNRTWFRFRVWVSTRKPHEVIAVSSFTKQEIEAYFPIFKDHVHIAYNALDTRFTQSNQKLPTAYGLSSQQYILGIGGMEKRKNNILTVTAYIKIVMDEPTFPLDLVILGMGNQAYENAQRNDISAIPKEIANRIHFFPGVSNEELSAFFHHAFVFVFPSTYEGFGMPILEAMAAHTPVITLNTTSLPEVAGDAGILIDNDSDQLKEAIEKIYKDKTLYQNLVIAGNRQVQTFSWEKGAREIENILN